MNMEITEKEREMLVKKKETICGLTLWILDNMNEPRNSTQIKKNFTSILSELNTIASYSDSKNYDLHQFTNGVNALFDLMTREIQMKMWLLSPRAIEKTCNYANSVGFDFTKKGLKINFPKNINLGIITNK
jgi:pyruvate/oxaloacetate carboxyltransferase